MILFYLLLTLSFSVFPPFVIRSCSTNENCQSAFPVYFLKMSVMIERPLGSQVWTLYNPNIDLGHK